MTYKQLPVIKLWDSAGTGLIISYPSGILITNQTGGTGCLNPIMEGVFVPLSNNYALPSYEFLSPERDLNSYFTNEKHGGHGATEGIDTEDLENITSILNKYGLDGFIIVNPEMLKQSHEAWIHVIIRTEQTKGLLNYFSQDLRGVLTWSNSD